MDIKEQIGNRITKARKQLGITIKELAARTGSLSAARISNWEQCTRSPGPVEAKMLAEQLDVSASYLLCLTDNPQGELKLSSNHPARFVPVLSMNEVPHAKELVKNQDARSLLFDAREKAVVVDQFNSSNSGDCLFAIQIEDSSMEPLLNAGDLVIVNADKVYQPGEIVVVYFPVKKQTVLRQYRESGDGLYQLVAHNDLWATVGVKEGDEAVICGVVVEHRRYL